MADADGNACCPKCVLIDFLLHVVDVFPIYCVNLQEEIFDS